MQLLYSGEMGFTLRGCSKVVNDVKSVILCRSLLYLLEVVVSAKKALDATRYCHLVDKNRSILRSSGSLFSVGFLKDLNLFKLIIVKKKKKKKL